MIHVLFISSHHKSSLSLFPPLRHKLDLKRWLWFGVVASGCVQHKQRDETLCFCLIVGGCCRLLLQQSSRKPFKRTLQMHCDDVMDGDSRTEWERLMASLLHSGAPFRDWKNLTERRGHAHSSIHRYFHPSTSAVICLFGSGERSLSVRGSSSLIILL